MELSLVVSPDKRQRREIMNSVEAEKIGRNEALFREVNERIAESAERFDSDEARFVCECSDAECTERVEVSLDEYERVRKDGARFLLVPGHEDRRIESVVDAQDGHAVVEKQDPLIEPLVRELDPRAA
jgi:hypothetical protein